MSVRRIVYLARHGETDWNKDGRWQGHTDVALNEAGRRQATVLGQRLHEMRLGIGAIVTSDLARARETAEIVGRALGLAAPGLDPALRERAFGQFEGLTRQECEEKFSVQWQDYREDPTRMPPGGEPHVQVIARMVVAVRRAALALVDGQAPVLLVSHGGSIRALMAHATGTPIPPIGNTAVFRLAVSADGFHDVVSLDVASPDVASPD